MDSFKSLGISFIDDSNIDKDAYGFIYLTINTVNGMMYIGKKCMSCDNWRRYLGSGIRLARAIRKYGRINFRRYIIDIAKSDDELNEKERYWISKFDAVKSESFYNIATGGDGGNVRSGYTDDEFKASESKRLAAVSKSMSERRGENASMAKLNEGQVVDIIQRLQEDERIRDIATDYGVSYATIMDIRSHNTWKHLTSDIEFQDISHRGTNTKDVWNTRAVKMYTKDMEYIRTFDTAREAERVTGIGFRLISQVCHYAKNSTHGYIFRFADEHNDPYDKSDNENISKRHVKCVETGKIYDCIKSAAIDIGIASELIADVCRGKRKKTAGYHWQYVD